MASADDTKESEKLLRDFLSKNKILIIDSVSSGRVSLAASLTKLGANRQQMALVGSLEEARDELEKNKPRIIVSDFMVGNNASLDLIQVQKQIMEKEQVKDTLFVLVTSNASQSTVARAAEEDVDTFVIKPYSMDMLKKALSLTLKQKIFPNQYMQLINEAKELMVAGNLDKAEELLTLALKEHRQPTLACFYLGQVEIMKQALLAAEGQFMDGLSYNKIHYKCLVGLFDLLYAEKKYLESYDVIKRLSQYFPANPKRLASVLRLAIMTDNFQDMEGFYRIFVKIDQRTDELIRYMCSALVVTGKYYLRQKIKTRAVEVFENAAVSAGGRVGFMLYVVEALVDFKMYEEIAPFVRRMQALAPTSKEFLAAQYLAIGPKVDVKDAIHQGRSVLKEGVEFPSVYERLILQSIQGGYKDAAFELAKFAIQKWPNKRNNFTHGFDPAELTAELLA